MIRTCPKAAVVKRAAIKAVRNTTDRMACASYSNETVVVAGLQVNWAMNVSPRLRRQNAETRVGANPLRGRRCSCPKANEAKNPDRREVREEKSNPALRVE